MYDIYKTEEQIRSSRVIEQQASPPTQMDESELAEPGYILTPSGELHRFHFTSSPHKPAILT